MIVFVGGVDGRLDQALWWRALACLGELGWFEFAFSNACIQLLQYLVLKYLIQEKYVHSVTRIWDYNVHFITLMKDETCASLVAAQNNNSYNKLIIPKVSRSNNNSKTLQLRTTWSSIFQPSSFFPSWLLRMLTYRHICMEYPRHRCIW